MTTDSRQAQGLLAIVVLGPLIFALGALFAMIMGAAAGWAGDLIFPDVFANLSALFWEERVPAWQIGAMLGFIVGFLRVSHPRQKRK